MLSEITNIIETMSNGVNKNVAETLRWIRRLTLFTFTFFSENGGMSTEANKSLLDMVRVAGLSLIHI